MNLSIQLRVGHMKYAAAIAKGIIRTRTGTWRINMTTYVQTVCSVCGEDCFVSKCLSAKGAVAICSQGCNAKRKSLAHTGRKRRNANAYIVVHRPDHQMSDKAGRLLEHRLIMAEHLGRLLEPREVVHHKDGNRSNNAIDNLDLMSGRKEHAAVHAKESELYQLRQQGQLRCSACREIKPLDRFDIGNTMRYGRKNQCKVCRSAAYKKAHPDAQPHDIVMRGRHEARWLASEAYQLFLAGKKSCRKCGTVKVLTDFSPYVGNKDGCMSYCRDCRNRTAREKK